MIVFFDGFCVLCNSFVDFLIRIDKKHLLKFASLQGRAYAELRKQNINLPADTTSIVVWTEGGVYTKSQGVFKILGLLGGFWSALTVFKFIPKVISDAVYDFVARYRYKIFGKKDVCRYPTAEERGQFLD